jgi:putative acetyltransferase
MIRREEPADIPAIRKVIEEAFRGDAEATLVDQIRADDDAVLSAIAIDQGNVVGHIMFSRMAGPFRVLGLAPVAVIPSHQRKQIGSRLIRWGIAQVKKEAWDAIFVLGNPDFYKRFGFDPALASGFLSPYAGPHLMVLALRGALPATTGRVDYAPAFAALG